VALKLRVISDHYKALGKRSSRLFGVTGGRIGRAQDNDWILPDPDRYVSSHHAKVSFRSGAWVLEDTSTNGIFINGADTPASVAGPYSLQDGDRLRLGDYEILVSIDERNDFPPDASGQIPIPKRVKGSNPPAIPVLNDDLGEELDITDLLNDPLVKPANEPFDLRKAFNLEPTEPDRLRNGLPADNSFGSLLDSLIGDSEPRTVVHGGKKEPAAAAKPAADKKADDWQMQTRPYDLKTMMPLNSPAALAKPQPQRTEPERPRRAAEQAVGAHSDNASGIEALCRGAGIDPASLPVDAQAALLTLAGQVLRESVLGLMEALKGRSDMKSRLRLSQTTIQPGENNPLKFSASVEEAVLKLLDPHGNRYLGPIEAIRESFADMRTHQTALAGAIQAAMDEFMSRIEPGELQERFDRGLKRGALLGAANKMKYWDLYVEFYQALNQRNEQGLPSVFAEELARTYAEKAAQKKK
jgi:type VI secretion system protein